MRVGGGNEIELVAALAKEGGQRLQCRICSSDFQPRDGRPVHTNRRRELALRHARVPASASQEDGRLPHDRKIARKVRFSSAFCGS